MKRKVSQVPKLIERLAEAEVKILLLLYSRGRLKLTDFPRLLEASYTTVYKALGNLKLLKLVEEDVEGRKRVFKLSQHGRFVTDKLKEIDEYLEALVGEDLAQEVA